MKEVMAEHSILVIKVANNYSNIQRMLLAAGEMKEEYWLDDPDHTGYFNREGLIALMEDHGMECLDFYGDTFVDLQLLNPYSNTMKSRRQATRRTRRRCGWRIFCMKFLRRENGGGVPSAGRDGFWTGNCGRFSEEGKIGK